MQPGGKQFKWGAELVCVLLPTVIGEYRMILWPGGLHRALVNIKYWALLSVPKRVGERNNEVEYDEDIEFVMGHVKSDQALSVALRPVDNYSRSCLMPTDSRNPRSSLVSYRWPTSTGAETKVPGAWRRVLADIWDEASRRFRAHCAPF